MALFPKLGQDAVLPQSEGTFDKALIDRIVFGRWWIPQTYHATLACVVLLFTILHWTRRSRPSATGSSLEKFTRTSAVEPTESSPLLDRKYSEQETHTPPSRWRLRLRAILMYQPPPIVTLNGMLRVLPSVDTMLFVTVMLGVNIFYLSYYTGSTIAVWSACILDRSGLLFVANLPWLYLLSAKNQPLRMLAGHSYENLNILHRRLGEWMCFLAICHVAGFFAFWWYYARPTSPDPLETLIQWLLQGFVLIGIGAFVSYEVLAATSTAAFRQWWYECFLASHIVLQAAGLVLLYFHHPSARNEALTALAVFIVDRVVYRAGLKSRTLKTDIEVLDDGETLLMSANWPLLGETPRWRRVLGKDTSNGWKPLEHVFISAPALGRAHALQAHPFTIASAAPEGDQQHAWLSLIVRARDGFTNDLLRHAEKQTTLDVRFDGPYGSQHAVEMLRHRDHAVLIAGGSGIAVAYPVVWSLLHDSTVGCRRVTLIWIVREASHLSWVGMERLDELRELGLQLVLPEPTTKAGRPDVQLLLEHAIETGVGAAVKTGVVVSAPDAMNRAVNNACASLAWQGEDIDIAVEKFGW